LSSEHFKLKYVKRVGLPEWFIKKRCTFCSYNEGIYKAKLLFTVTYIVYCECELGVCPYIGLGYIRKGDTPIEKSRECEIKRVSL